MVGPLNQRLDGSVFDDRAFDGRPFGVASAADEQPALHPCGLHRGLEASARRLINNCSTQLTSSALGECVKRAIISLLLKLRKI